MPRSIANSAAAPRVDTASFVWTRRTWWSAVVAEITRRSAIWRSSRAVRAQLPGTLKRSPGDNAQRESRTTPARLPCKPAPNESSALLPGSVKTARNRLV